METRRRRPRGIVLMRKGTTRRMRREDCIEERERMKMKYEKPFPQVLNYWN
jgi:hypothetical protein